MIDFFKDIDHEKLQSGDMEELDKASERMLSAWFFLQIQITSIKKPELDELAFIKSEIVSEAGKYVMLIHHIEGEKIQLKQIRGEV